MGGTALSLRIGHRLSEDLDFFYSDPLLPGKRLDLLRKKAIESGIEFQHQDDPGALEEFERVKMELHDYQQDYIVNRSVKVTFLTGDESLCRLIKTFPSAALRIAELPELFRSKAILSSQRSKSRDWFDLFTLMTAKHFTFSDYVEAFQYAGIPTRWESGAARICSGHLSESDEGYAHLGYSLPAIEELAAYFREQRDEYEIKEAELAKRHPQSSRDSGEVD